VPEGRGEAVIIVSGTQFIVIDIVAGSGEVKAFPVHPGFLVAVIVYVPGVV
jgi:hypothetical protein